LEFNQLHLGSPACGDWSKEQIEHLNAAAREFAARNSLAVKETGAFESAVKETYGERQMKVVFEPRK
jgi:hypothetical protein